jgi:hypothetical protein
MFLIKLVKHLLIGLRQRLLFVCVLHSADPSEAPAQNLFNPCSQPLHLAAKLYGWSLRGYRLLND